MSAATGAIEVVDLEERHLRAVMRIDALAYPQPWSKRLWKAELSRDGRVYLVGLVGGEVVGYAGALVVEEEAHVTTVVAAEGSRRGGVGSTLMIDLIGRCVALGATALTLEVRMGNEPAQAMYRRFGMAPVGVRKGYYEPENEDALIMWAHEIDLPPYAERLERISRELGRKGAVA